MIFEALHHLTHPAPRYVKKLGYLREAIAIEARYKRCAHHWLAHLNKCKQLIIDAAATLEENARILIVGSGGLHDVPVEILSLRGFEIECVDIVHLSKVQKKYPYIQFTELDVTGISEALYQQRSKSQFKPHSFESNWKPAKTPDLIISLNLLSQLPIMPMAFAKHHQIALPKEFEFHIHKAHVEWLKEICPNIVIITDIERRYFYKGDHIKSTRTFNEGKTNLIGPPQEQWIWNIAPVGEADKEIGIEHVVGAWFMNP